MDIENTSDQHSTREQLENAVDVIELLLQQLQKLGLQKDEEVTVMVGTQNVYKGNIGGEGKREELDEKQAKTLQQALDPKQGSGSVRILDQDRNVLFHSKNGVILKNELHQLQKETEATIEPETESKQANSPAPAKSNVNIGQSQAKPDYSQSKDIPSLDDAEAQTESPTTSPTEQPAASQALEAEAQPVQSSPQNETQPTDPIARQNQINQENPQPAQAQQSDPLEELGQIAVNQAEQIAELQAKLTEVNGKLDELTAWKESITPMKLANERVGNWLNQQRDKMASKVHSFANRLAATAAQKFEQVQDQVTEKIDEGRDRHQAAVNEVKAQVTEKVGEARQSLETRFEEAKQRHNQALGEMGQKAAQAFMSKFVDPTAKMLVSQMERVGEVKVHNDGTKSFETDAVSWNVHPDGSTSLSKSNGQNINPQNVTIKEMDVINATVQKVNEKFGLQQSQAQSQSQGQTQSASPNPVKEVVEAAKEAPKAVKEVAQAVKELPKAIQKV